MKTNMLALSFKRSVEFILILSFAVLLPIMFHAAGLKGNIFLPIYTAVLIGAFAVNPHTALVAALLTPMLNHLLTGMPAVVPFPALQFLTVEIIFIALSASIFRKYNVSYFISIPTAVMAGRISSLILVPFMQKLTLGWWTSHLVESIPGILLNIVVALLIVLYFKKKNG